MSENARTHRKATSYQGVKNNFLQIKDVQLSKLNKIL